MSLLFTLCQWLERSSMGTAVRESTWLFPTIETLHIFGIILLVGSTSILDLRLLGWAFREDSVSQLARRYLPWTWAGFVIQLLSGFLLFASEASKMYGNPSFQVKMLLIVLAGVNAFVFHTVAYRKVAAWDNAPVAPLAARFAGCFSILLWFGIVAAGRWIAFV